MKAFCKAVSFVLALIIGFGAGAVSVRADYRKDVCLDLYVEKTGNTLELVAAATEDLVLSGATASFTYDSEAMTIREAKAAPGLQNVLNTTENVLVLYSESEPEVKKGETVFSFVFETTEAYDPQKEYEFVVEMEEFFDNELVDYDWVPAKIALTYQETEASDSSEQAAESSAAEPAGNSSGEEQIPDAPVPQTNGSGNNASGGLPSWVWAIIAAVAVSVCAGIFAATRKKHNA